MNSKMILIWVLLMFILTGCFGPKEVKNSGAIGIGNGEIRVEIWASTNCIQPGDTVIIKATLTNQTTQVQRSTLQDRPVLDIHILNPTTGTEVHWSDGRPMDASLTQLELEPGQSKTIEMDWTVPKEGFFGYIPVTAVFIYNQKQFNNPASAGIGVDVGTCPGIGP